MPKKRDFVRLFHPALLVLLLVSYPGVQPLNASDGPVLRVSPDESIQAALDRAEPGATITVEPGVYREALMVETPNLTLRGLVRGDSRPILEGDSHRSDGVIATSDSFAMSGFRVQNYRGNGVTTQGSRSVTLEDLKLYNTGFYGLYTVRSRDIRIRHCTATKAEDAGLYVGQSHQAKVTRNDVHENVVGIEIENTINASVHHNRSRQNTVGIFVVVMPGNEQKVGRDSLVYDNYVIENNHNNFGDTATLIGELPPGLGIAVMGADSTTVRHNRIRGNRSLGVTVLRLPHDQARRDPKLDPLPDHTRIIANQYRRNGFDPHPRIRRSFGGGGDLGWDGTGNDNCAAVGQTVERVDRPLPSCTNQDQGPLDQEPTAPTTNFPSPSDKES